ncbi:helix-turn-helix transcriptional regulator [Bacteroidia bacterium]|nr:helix-turn-helix transcriptional regulator [Bacteroidia bacterium]
MSISLKIAIAESSPVIRAGVEVQLKKLPGFRFQFIEIEKHELLIDSLRKHKPDVLLVNPLLMQGLTLQQLRNDSGCLPVKCIALLHYLADKALLRLFDEQISIYDSPGEIKQKLDSLYAEKLQSQAGNDEQRSLSTREKEIVVCVVKGMTNRAIAGQLFLSTHTVITHRRNIARKLQIHSVSGLTVYAIVNKLVELSEVSRDRK